jgi:hypothetical protein
VAALLPEFEVGVGNASFALIVGESGVGKPGYLRPTSVRRVKLGRAISDAVFELPTSTMGCLLPQSIEAEILSLGLSYVGNVAFGPRKLCCGSAGIIG